MPLIPTMNTLKLPEHLEDSGLIVGWSLERGPYGRRPVGFSYGPRTSKSRSPKCIDPILMEREGHLMTIAPTGAGKGTGCIVPALLRYEGPVIVIDPKGENALMTSRRRREMGQEVAVIDPMGITGLPSASLNPLDVLDPDSPTFVDDAMAVVSAMASATSGKSTSDGEYWRERGSTFLLGIVLHVVSDLPPGQRHLETVRELVNQTAGELGLYTSVSENQGTEDRLAGTVLAALESSRNSEARNIGRMLRIGAHSTMGGIVSFTQSFVDIVRSGIIGASVRQTSFDLGAVQRGDPLSIYLVLPPHMLESHGRLLRLWVHTLMTQITSRGARPKHSTLFILDEAAQLGTFDDLRRAITLMRGYGLQTWSFWQDPSQLQHLYPHDWPTMVNNCRAVQCFGANTMMAAEAMARLVGFDLPTQLLELEDNEILLQLSGDMPVIARLPNYLTDPVFAGMAEANPYHDPTRPVQKPKPVRRVFERTPPQPIALQPSASEVLSRLQQLDSQGQG